MTEFISHNNECPVAEELKQENELIYLVDVDGYGFDEVSEDYYNKIGNNAEKRIVYNHAPDSAAIIAKLEADKVELLGALRVSTKHIQDWWWRSNKLPPSNTYDVVTNNEAIIAKIEGKA